MQFSDGLLTGKKIVVVGGAGFLGAKICDSLINEGASCVIADINLEKAESVSAEIEIKSGIKPDIVEVSIIDPDSVDNMLEECVNIMGSIDCLVNTSYPRNQNYGRKFEDVEFSDFCENVNLHLGGYFLVSQKILEYFKANNGGKLLNMSSIYGVVAPRFNVYEGTKMTMPVEYAAIKSSLIHLTKYMARYYAGNNIKVNSVSLGGLLDAQPEWFLIAYRNHCLDKGMLNPEDITGTIIYLLSDAAHFVNGQNIIVDDGFTI